MPNGYRPPYGGRRPSRPPPDQGEWYEPRWQEEMMRRMGQAASARGYRGQLPRWQQHHTIPFGPTQGWGREPPPLSPERRRWEDLAQQEGRLQMQMEDIMMKRFPSQADRLRWERWEDLAQTHGRARMGLGDLERQFPPRPALPPEMMPQRPTGMGRPPGHPSPMAGPSLPEDASALLRQIVEGINMWRQSWGDVQRFALIRFSDSFYS